MSNLNILSNLFNPPILIASAASLAIHGLLAVNLPNTSPISKTATAGSQTTANIPVVELTPEETARLPQLTAPQMRLPSVNGRKTLPSSATSLLPVPSSYPPLPSYPSVVPPNAVSAAPLSRGKVSQSPQYMTRLPAAQQANTNMPNGSRFRLYEVPVFSKQARTPNVPQQTLVSQARIPNVPQQTLVSQARIPNTRSQNIPSQRVSDRRQLVATNSLRPRYYNSRLPVLRASTFVPPPLARNRSLRSPLPENRVIVRRAQPSNNFRIANNSDKLPVLSTNNSLESSPVENRISQPPVVENQQNLPTVENRVQPSPTVEQPIVANPTTQPEVAENQTKPIVEVEFTAKQPEAAQKPVQIPVEIEKPAKQPEAAEKPTQQPEIAEKPAKQPETVQNLTVKQPNVAPPTKQAQIAVETRQKPSSGDRHLQKLVADNQSLRQELKRDEAGTTREDAHNKYVNWLAQVKKGEAEQAEFVSGNYPQEACLKKIEGTTTIGALINQSGNIVGAPVMIKSSGYKILNRQALEDVKSQVFTNQTGEPQPYVVEVKFEYKQKNCRALSVVESSQDQG